MKKLRACKDGRISQSLTAAILVLMTFTLAACAMCGNRADIERLIAIQDIEQLRSRFVNAVDNRRWTELRDEILAPDLVVDLPAAIVDKSAPPELRKRISGVDAFIALARGVIGDKPGGNHSATNPVIEILSATTAKAIWRMGTASYYDTYEKTNGRWYIKTFRFEPNEPGQS